MIQTEDHRKGIYTDEEMAQLKEQLWARCKGEIEKMIESTIYQELRISVHSELRRRASVELMGMLRAKIAEKHEVIDKQLDKIVDNIGNLAVKVVQDEFVGLFSLTRARLVKKVEEIQNGYTSAFSDKLKSALEEAVSNGDLKL